MLVLYASEQLGLGPVGFGLLSTAVAVGGLVGTLSYDWLERRARLADLLRVGLIIETLTHLGLAVTTTAWVAMAIMFVFGAHAFVWGTPVAAPCGCARCRPSCRAGSAACTPSACSAASSSGRRSAACVAQVWGVTAPFWFAFVGSALILALIWGALGDVAHADEAS